MLTNRVIMASAITIYFLTAFFSTSFYQADEHFQIVEFAELISGNNHGYDLAWEYGAHIRSSLQPAVLHLIFSALRCLNVTNVYILMLIVRLVTATFSIYVINKFIESTKDKIIRKDIVFYRCLSYMLWFLPFINVRFSSETYSGLFFILALCTFLIVRNIPFFYQEYCLH